MKKQDTMKSIIFKLMLSSSCIEEIGLFRGKIGISLFFFMLSRSSGKKMYQKFGEKLVEESLQDITEDCPIRFDNGLLGIGFAFSYFATNGFLKLGDDFFQEIDKKLEQLDVSMISNHTIEDGLAGIGCYVIARIYLNPGYKVVQKKFINEVSSALLRSNDKVCRKLFYFINCTELLNINPIDTILKEYVIKKTTSTREEFGLHRGLAGHAIYLLKDIYHENYNL